jgi:hypothetical protein
VSIQAPDFAYPEGVAFEYPVKQSGVRLEQAATTTKRDRKITLAEMRES